MKQSPRCVLTIAGSDSGAGAGVQADSRTIHALGGFALTAITAVTAQNTRGISMWRATAPSLIAEQITAVLSDFSVHAIKTGLLSGAASVRAVARALERFPRIPMVVDPVLGSTSGTRFLAEDGVRALQRYLLPRATLLTPNWPEAARLSGRTVTTDRDAEAAGRALLQSGCRAVLVKGGHAPGGHCRDCLVTEDGGVRWFAHARVVTRNTHGTGCVLSAAIATGLAQGKSVDIAVGEAEAFLQRSLKAGRNTVWGEGAGPAFAG